MGKTIYGTNGADTIRQSDFSPSFALNIYAGRGNDIIVLDRDDDLGGDNFVDAGAGRDQVFNFFEGGNIIKMGGGADVYVGTGFAQLGGSDFVDGGGGADRFYVSTLASNYFGNTGNDYFTSHGWQNAFDGGDGIDTISYEFRHEDSVIGSTGVTIDLNAGQVATGALRRETVTNIENAIGSQRADIIGGQGGDNVLSGLGGDDDIYGFGGNDVLAGGFGIDYLFGGTGADRFVFAAAGESGTVSSDQIFDFSRTEGDRIDLSQIDANSLLAGDQAFSYLGIARFSGHAGEARFQSGRLEIDINGDARADMAVLVDGQSFLLAADLIL